MSTLRVNEITHKTGTGDIVIPTGNKIIGTDVGSVYAPGHVIQMVHTVITTPTSVAVPNTVSTNTNIPDLSCSITPKNASSRVYVQVRWFGEINAQTQNWNTMFGLKRNNTAVGVNPGAISPGTAAHGISMAALSYYLSDAASTPEMLFFDFYDTPNTTSATVYQVYANTVGATATIFTNRTVGTAGEYGSSTITLWEIAQ